MALEPDVALAGHEPLGDPGGVEQGSGEVEQPHDQGVVQGDFLHSLLEPELEQTHAY